MSDVPALKNAPFQEGLEHITLQVRLIGLWTASCSPFSFLDSRPSTAASSTSTASPTMALPIAIVHSITAAFVDGRRWAVEAILAVNLAVFKFFVGRLAVLVFSGDVA